MGDALNGDAASIEDREHEEPIELFPDGSLEGDAVTAQTLVRKGMTTEVTVSLGRAEVPTKAGLLNPDKGGRVFVSYVPGKVEHVPDRDDDGKVVGWKLRQHLRPTYVQDANDDVNVAREAFGQVMALDAQKAAELHSELGAMLAGGTAARIIPTSETRGGEPYGYDR
jgi:hypothetical protein